MWDDERGEQEWVSVGGLKPGLRFPPNFDKTILPSFFHNPLLKKSENQNDVYCDM